MAIGRYEVSIGSMQLPRVRHLEVEPFVRNETRTTSFAGTDRVDRSKIKLRVNLTISICSAEEYEQIYALASQIMQSVTFPFGSGTETRDMIVDLPKPPEPRYKFGDKTEGIYYINLPVSMEEA
jgi:hypothetical protein